MRTPQTVTEFASLIEQAVFEFEDLTRCAVEDMDDETGAYVFDFENMTIAMRELQSEVSGKSDYRNEQGFKYMSRVKMIRSLIPFYQLIVAIDVACKQGVNLK